MTWTLSGSIDTRQWYIEYADMLDMLLIGESKVAIGHGQREVRVISSHIVEAPSSLTLGKASTT